jgi:hypothetical protein
MKDVELVLRFAAFYHSPYYNYKPPMRLFLNDDMRRYQFISDNDASNLERDFKNAVGIIYSMLYDNGVSHAFKRYYAGNSLSNPNGYWETKKFNYSLYDILMHSFAHADRNKVQQKMDTIRDAFIYLMVNNKEFIDSIEKSTSTIQAVVKRFDKWRIMLQDIIGIAEKEPRCFTYAQKRLLFDERNICELCKGEIHDIDDAHVDHIDQYWRGGKTESKNARLTHRYCNLSRPRDD